MPTFEFTVALDRAPADDDFDRLFDAGLDDTTPETRDGRGVLNVARDAASMSAAIVSVVRDVARAGFRVVGVEDDDLVSLKTVAQRTGRSYESVRLLATGKRGPGEFPEPLSGDGWALYSWALVAEWYSRNYGADAVPAVSPDQRVLAAAALMLRAATTAGPATAELAELITSTAAPQLFEANAGSRVRSFATKEAATTFATSQAGALWSPVMADDESPDRLDLYSGFIAVMPVDEGWAVSVGRDAGSDISVHGRDRLPESVTGPRGGTYERTGPVSGSSKTVRDGGGSTRNAKGRA